VQLALGDTDGYRKTCAGLLDRFGKTQVPGVAQTVARTCVLAPNAVSDLSRPAALMDRAVSLTPSNPGLLNTFGSLLYRAAQFEAAITRLKEGLAMSGQGGEPRDWIFLAMTHQALGHADEARDWLTRSVQRIDSPASASLPWEERLELQLLRREAEALIRPGTP
jgi:hypothetical protein